MKLTTFLLIIALVHVNAKEAYSQITLNAKHATLASVLTSIKQQTGYVFFSGDIDLTQQTVDVKANNVSLNDALALCFKNLALDYKVDGKTVFIKAKEASLFDKIKAAFAQVTVTGKVTDELGDPMSGVTVREKGTNNATITDKDGTYHLRVTDSKALIDFTYIGYEPQELAAKDLPDGSTVILKAATQNLQEVVVNKGYYYEKKELSTGDVSVVGAKTIEQQPVSDPTQALIGQVAGLNIQQTSGIPGSYATIHIRGLNSIGAGNDPFYVVDGVPFSSVSLTDPEIGGGALKNPNFNFVGSNGSGQSPFNALNPDDIESIEVLKDADATAIYGSRGANDVILITTKKGKAGETKVNVDMSQGIGQVGHFMDLLNTQQYLQMRHQAYTNDGITSIPSNAYDINGVWDTTRNTNWQKVLIGNTAHYTNAQASISGGNANTQFLIGGGYYRSTTVFPGDYDDRKGSLHFSLTNTSSNQRFKAVLTVSYVNENNNVPGTDLTSFITLAPDAPAIYNPNGSFNWQILNGTATFNGNPLRYTLQSDASVTSNLVSNLNLSYQILPGLILSGSFGYNHDEMNQTFLSPASAAAPPNNTNPNNRLLELANDFNNSWIIEPQLSYQKRIGKGQLNVLIGGTLQQSTSQYFANEYYGFTSDALISDPAAATNSLLEDAQYSLYRYEALVARIGYTWDEKYLLNLTANRDGSSRFGPGKQYGNFGSIGAGWIFFKEKAVEDATPWLNFGKLRVSYGTTGNDQIGNYQYLSTYTPNSMSYQSIAGLAPNGLANAEYSWEMDKKLEGGLDLGFLNDRIDLSLSYYRNRTGNQLVGYALPMLTGFTSVQYNLPAEIQNTGLEAELHTSNIQSKEFNWTTSANFTLPNNKLVSYPGIAGSSYANTYVVGQSLFIQKRYDYTGLNPQTGLYTFATPNANGIPSSPRDKVATQPITQKYYGGIGNDITYKSFGLEVFVQVVKQLGLAPAGYFSQPGTVNANEPSSVLGAWHTPGKEATVQRYSTGGTPSTLYNDYVGSQARITDASFIRIKNAELYYRLPVGLQGWAHMQNARIYIQGQNLYTFTKLQGLDPETQGLTLPPLRVIMAGISATF